MRYRRVNFVMENVISPLYLVCVLLLVGCSDASEELVDARELASSAYEEANTTFEQKNYEAAEAKYTEAIDSGGMFLDSLVSATINRAVCRAFMGDATQAKKDLDLLREQAGEDSALFHSAMSYVLSKQGKSRESKLALSYAKRKNKNVFVFSE